MAIDVFISVGRTFSKNHEEFVSALEDLLRANGLNPRAVGRSDFTHKNPLKFIDDLMKECSATIIVAFERVRVVDGIERRGSPEQEILRNQNITTAWNQIEAAMAYTRGHSLFVLVENGCRSEGLLESGYDWYVQHVDLSRETLTTKAFIGSFTNWKNEVLEKEKSKSELKKKPVDGVDKMTIGQLFSSLQLSHLLTLIGLVVAYTALLITLITRVLLNH